MRDRNERRLSIDLGLHAMRTLVGFFAAALLFVGFSNVQAGDRVGNPLLRQLSEAIALAKLCPSIETDNQRISQLVEQASISQASVADAVEGTLSAILEEAPAAHWRWSCKLALAHYGPTGSRLAGLVRSTATAALDPAKLQ